MIELTEASVTYPGAAAPALDGVCLRIEPGRTLALLGPNGSGKSTLARLCNALLLPSAGSVTVDGMDTADESHVWEVRSRVGFVQQNPENQIVGTVVEEDVAFGPENLGVPTAELRVRVDESLAAVGLTGLERREPHLLSEGQKQRLAIAGALALQPSYLVLDEPTAMLDGAGRTDVLEALATLRDRGVGIIHITHHLEDVLDADAVAVLDAGRIAFEGTPADLFADPSLSSALGVDLPPVVVLAAALRQRGVSLAADARTAEAIVEALWRS
ncbi:MAG TPA: energy-coupling factor transporter ATPase [Coriobacteriia bacterium]|nr:energy-coupling factor transporter ATPase [Coriobacteriia bacterium]